MTTHYLLHRKTQSRTRMPALTLSLALALALTSTASFAGPCNSVVYSPTVTTERAAGMDTELWAQHLVSGLFVTDDKGWAATLTNAKGERIATVTQGLARTQCDPGGERTFTAHTETPWGSVSKLITTAAAIHAAENQGVNLDSPLVNYLPQRWRNQLHSRFAFGQNGSGPVTLRMMLQHRGGFQHSSCGGRDIKARLLDGDLAECHDAAPPTVGTRSYANMSLAIYQIALAYMAYPGNMLYWENFASGYSNEQYDAFIQTVTNNTYRSYVGQQLFAPNGISAVCNMAELASANASGNYTMWYDSSIDSSGTLPHDQNHTCAAGAWSMSSAEMASFLLKLQDGQSILSMAGYALMEAGASDSLGWWRQNWALGTTYSHNGAWGDTRAEVRSLPGGHVATLVMNSGALDGYADTFNLAWQAGRTHGIVQAHAVLYRGY